MGVNIANFSKLSELVSLSSLRKPKIVLNPEEEYYIKYKSGRENREDLNANIICDRTNWTIPEEVQVFVNELSKNSQLSNEDKILLIYEKLCQRYTYDDNILSYIKKIDDDKFDLPDWYGRDINKEWKDNREEHDRRVCYEVSRYLAKSLTELFKGEENYNVCILWDKDLTHYFVGLTCKDYTLTLDLDNFNNIKDLTRLKTGLTADGIVILEDNEGKFKNSLDKFNEDRSKYAVKKIESEIENTSSKQNIENDNSNKIDEPEDIAFLRNAIEILKEKYDIDSQGLFEYMKEIVDIKLGPEARAKVWKKIEGKSNEETRHMRCLVLNIDNQKYIIDVDKKELRSFDESEFTRENVEFIPYKQLYRDWDEYYHGT